MNFFFISIKFLKTIELIFVVSHLLHFQLNLAITSFFLIAKIKWSCHYLNAPCSQWHSVLNNYFLLKPKLPSIRPLTRPYFFLFSFPFLSIFFFLYPFRPLLLFHCKFIFISYLWNGMVFVCLFPWMRSSIE